ncbi:hypothetical protein OG609_00500 [Streptomyces sp. NBC_01224]|uniref:hypothetical protein n=1 Tax=Streptomyces sp. NBC_01224 TaxID=2903783 RepID=UPI002E16712A|nr:hypothetical protein OG609_00500 [Streptomyces sp. NBC_01224]
MGGQVPEDQGERREFSKEPAVDLAGRQRLGHAVLVLADLDAAGGIAEDQACSLGPSEQKAQGAELVSAVVAVQGLEVGEGILAGHLPQVVVAV